MCAAGPNMLRLVRTAGKWDEQGGGTTRLCSAMASPDMTSITG